MEINIYWNGRTISSSYGIASLSIQPGVIAMRTRPVLLVMLLFLVAISEVATTGSFFNYFGIWNLIGIYVVTTSIGAAILLAHIRNFRRISDKYEIVK